MTKRTKKKKAPSGPTGSEAATAIGGLALLGSILKNLSQSEENAGLLNTVSALQNLVRDWQLACSQLDTQLQFALQANALQQQQIQELRNQVQAAQERTYAAEQRALGAEAQVTQLQSQLAAEESDEEDD